MVVMAGLAMMMIIISITKIIIINHYDHLIDEIIITSDRGR